ncbi:MAG: type II toxin-antitoxin system VapC family toxin [Candidatus Firestonebacteria bacterium]
MRKLKIYLDTSIINFAIDARSPKEKEITLVFFDEIKKGKYDIFISELVTAEIDKAPKEIAEKLRSVIQKLSPEELAITEEAEILADKYIEQGIIPIKYANDAAHIAIASVSDLDIVLSWNFEHMVKHKTRVEVMGVNTFMGYKTIDICTPQEVV